MKKYCLFIIIIMLTTWSACKVRAQAGYTDYSFQGTVKIILVDNGGLFTGTQVGDTFNGSFQYGLTDADADEIDPGDEGGHDGADYNFWDWPYGSFITNGTISVSRDTVKCGTGNNRLMEDEEPEIFSVLSDSVVELGHADSWDVHYDGVGQSGKLEFGVAIVSWNNLDWLTDEEFYAMPPNPEIADIKAFFIYENDVSDECIFCAWGLIDQLDESPQVIELLIQAKDVIAGLPVEVFRNQNMGVPLINKIDAVLTMLDQGDYEEALNSMQDEDDYEEALNKLKNDILAKTNGCAEIGTPDNNDWILTCEAQNEVYPLILEAIELLEDLI